MLKSTPARKKYTTTSSGGRDLYELCPSASISNYAGDVVNWEEAEWTLHSMARVIKANVEGEGPCRKESQVQVFLANFNYHKDCMQHCEKISGGRSPSVTTRGEWEYFTREVDVIIPPHHRVCLLYTSPSPRD